MDDPNLMLTETDEPPTNFPPPLQALWWLKKGGLVIGSAWEKAHELCQMKEGDPKLDLVHALVHWIEGDTTNTAYWYRRVGEQRASSIDAEWHRIATRMFAAVRRT